MQLVIPCFKYPCDTANATDKRQHFTIQAAGAVFVALMFPKAVKQFGIPGDIPSDRFSVTTNTCELIRQECEPACCVLVGCSNSVFMQYLFNLVSYFFYFTGGFHE